jgi:hypothetical protein
MILRAEWKRIKRVATSFTGGWPACQHPAARPGARDVLLLCFVFNVQGAPDRWHGPLWLRFSQEAANMKRDAKMNPKTPDPIKRQEELRRQGIGEDHAARIEGTPQDATRKRNAPDAHKWQVRKNSKTDRHDE